MLVAVLPSVWFNETTNDLLGWSQFESTDGKRIVAPEICLNTGGVVLPAVLRVAHHHAARVGDGVVGAAAELVVANRRDHRGDPVGAASRRRRDVGERVQVQHRLATRAQTIRGNPVAGKWLTGERVDRRRQRASGDRRATEVAIPLGLCRHELVARRPAIFDVPLDVAKEVQFVADDRTADRAAEVVALQRGLRLVVELRK